MGRQTPLRTIMSCERLEFAFRESATFGRAGNDLEKESFPSKSSESHEPPMPRRITHRGARWRALTGWNPFSTRRKSEFLLVVRFSFSFLCSRQGLGKGHRQRDGMKNYFRCCLPAACSAYETLLGTLRNSKHSERKNRRATN